MEYWARSTKKKNLMEIREIGPKEKSIIKQVVQIHLETFQGFFLTFMGKGFLKQLYSSYCRHNESGLLVVFEDNQPVGFLAYSGDYSGLFKYMIRTRLIPFAWFSLGAFFRKPKSFMRLIRAFSKSKETKREEKYIELASIGVRPEFKSKGIGTSLINHFKSGVDFSKYAYINLETDADNNEAANCFYIKNGFELSRTYETKEGRKMNEYRYLEK